LTDGKHYKILPSAKDYKRIGEGDTGLNTGGMGAVSPVPFADKSFMHKVEQQIVIPTLHGLREENIHYVGFIFIGLMNVNGNPFVIEYNCRMGDPETEVVFPLIDNDFVQLFTATATGNLKEVSLRVNSKTAVTVMLVSQGYPGDYEKGKIITGLNKETDSLIFHAGTQKDMLGEIVTNGGRVIAITSFGDSVQEAVAKSMDTADAISFEGKYFRRDIGYEFL
jgi:phosphoribosylamine--glycine ligase